MPARIRESVPQHVVGEIARQPTINSGRVGELLAAAHLTASYAEVTWPAPPEAPYDLTVCFLTANGRGNAETVQVKYLSETRNSIRLRRGRRKWPDNRRYAVGDFDHLGVVRGDAFWLIPFSALTGRTSITITSPEWDHFRLPSAMARIEELARARRADAAARRSSGGRRARTPQPPTRSIEVAPLSPTDVQAILDD